MTVPAFRTWTQDEVRPFEQADLHRAVLMHLPDDDDRRGVLRMLDQPPGQEAGRPQGGGKRVYAHSELRTALAHGVRSPGEAARYLLYRYQFATYPAERRLTPFPLVLAVEPTSVCNLRCPMCFITDPRLSEDRALRGRMDLGLYKRIMEEAHAHALPALILASRGEPTLHPDLPVMLAMARVAGILDIKMNTNATRLTERLAGEILAADPDLVVFSVDTHDPALYPRLRVGGSFESVRVNIERFHAIRARDYPESRTRTRATLVVQTPEQDIEASRAFWIEQGCDEVGVNPVRERPHLYDGPDLPESTPCSLLWERLYVWWEGTVNPCDADYLSHLSPGKLGLATSIADFWRGDVMTALRDRHAAGFKGAASPCSKCEGY